jgi:hypothetical protein
MGDVPNESESHYMLYMNIWKVTTTDTTEF